MDVDEGLSRPAGGTTEEPEGIAKRFMLAWIGAMAEAYDNADETFDRLVHRGEEVQSEWQERMDQARSERQRSRFRMWDAWRGTMDAFREAFDVPSKSEVDAMNVKLNIILRKLDDLAVEHAAEGTPGEPFAPSPEVPPPPADGDMAT